MLNAQLLFDPALRVKIQARFNTIWVAYSGGVDSHVLLDLAQQAFTNVRALHIHHGISLDDDRWQEHCRQICKQRNIPLDCIQVDAAPKPGQSAEETARTARRNVWAKILTAKDLLLLGHHADDQAETILFRLLRGAGPHGLTGMHTFSKLAKTTLWRPMLNVTKQAILQYAGDHNLQWLDDPSNESLAYDRNYLRHKILPLLQARWPKTVANINRAGSICAQMLQAMEPHVQSKLATVVTANLELNIAQLQTQELFWQQALLRAWLMQYGLIPSLRQINKLQQEIIPARIDAMPQLKIGQKIIRRSKNLLFVLADVATQDDDFVVAWDVRQHLQLPNGLQLHAREVFTDQATIDKLATQQITVRMGKWGRKAKKIFQEHAVPPWERANYPLIFANDKLVSIVGLWNTATCT